MKIQYTVTKCKKTKNVKGRNDKEGGFVGPIHAAENAETTFCGEEINENWWILTAHGIESCPHCKKPLTNITCPKCNKIIEEAL